MKKVFLFSVLLIFCRLSIRAQGELDTQDKIFYRNERSIGLNLNSNGLGFGYRYGKWLNARNRKLFEIDGEYLKHPKEIKYPYVYNYYNTRSFIYGKLNTLVTFRGGPGFQRELYQKVDKGGISIRYFYSGGLSIALYKPVYYDIYTYQGNFLIIEQKKFDSSIQHANIAGRSSFFKGIKETKFLPGIYGKAGLSFEYSTVDELLHAIEVGVSLEAFPKKIPIMATDRNTQLFFGMFVSYRFGKIIDPLKTKFRPSRQLTPQQ
jgi:hypothetical protein